MQLLTDEELVLQYRSQPPGPKREVLINELFQRHYRRVGVWCLRLTGEREAAADLAQEIFAKAYRNLEQFRGDSKFTTWLYTITRNHFANDLKSKATTAERLGDSLDIEMADARQEDPLAGLQRQQTAAYVRDLMQRHLDETEMQVMTLHYAEEMPLEAVTRLLGLTNASGAKAYIVSAKRKLSTAIQRLAGRAGNPGNGR